MRIIASAFQHIPTHFAAFAGAALRTAIHEDIGRLRKEHAAAQRQTAAQELAANRQTMVAAQHAISTVLAQRPAQPIPPASGSGVRRPAEALPLRVSLYVCERQRPVGQALALALWRSTSRDGSQIELYMGAGARQHETAAGGAAAGARGADGGGAPAAGVQVLGIPPRQRARAAHRPAHVLHRCHRFACIAMRVTLLVTLVCQGYNPALQAGHPCLIHSGMTAWSIATCH